MDFGTDNSFPFDYACLAVPGPGHGLRTVCTLCVPVMNPILTGDGGTVYIPRGNYLLLPGILGINWDNVLVVRDKQPCD